MKFGNLVSDYFQINVFITAFNEIINGSYVSFFLQVAVSLAPAIGIVILLFSTKEVI